MNGRPYRPHGPIAPAAPLESGAVAWCRRNRRWLPLWAALGGFLFFCALLALGQS